MNDKTVRGRDLVRMWNAPIDIRGRFAAILVNSNNADMACVALYYPPRSEDPTVQMRLTSSVANFNDFVQIFFADLSGRAVPMSAVALSDGV
eukprot:3443552-Pyramimonas_sp.AAC.1